MRLKESLTEAQFPWLLNIPADWQVAPLFSHLSERKVRNHGVKESTVLSLSYGSIVLRDVESNFGLLPESFETYQVVEPGNVVLRLTDLQNDKRSLRVGLVRQRGIMTSAYVSLEAKPGLVADYAYYLLHSLDIQKVFYNLGAGVRQSMGYVDLKHLPLPLPPVLHQQAIAAFLDRETSRIDSIIQLKQRQIELLEEKRVALITQAVTKGLDPNVKMKDSGVEWLGEIPEHWELRRVKQFTSVIRSGKTPRGGAEVYQASGVPLIRSQNVHFGELRLDDVAFIDETIDEEMSNTRVRPLDLLLNITGASIGRCALVPDPFPHANVNQHVCIVRVKSGLIDPGFLSVALCSQVVQDQIMSTQVGASRQGLNFEEVGGLLLAVPPDLTEQAQIAEAAARVAVDTQASSRTISRSIELLQEYRSALISAAVTGQIDVRGEVSAP